MEEKQKPKITDPAMALAKMQGWCAYQERCQQEVRDKLYEFGLWPEAVENIITDLISNNFINEERFATAYAGGKFRVKRWGKIKIRMMLKQKRVSDYSIKQALALINDEDYFNAIKKVIEIKLKTLHSEKNAVQKKYKLIKHAQSKGFETDLIVEVLKELALEKEEAD